MAGIGLAAALLAYGPVQAQDYAPPGYAQRADDGAVLGNPDALALNAQNADPSARIATLTDVAGGISFAPAGSDEWAATGLNRPVTTGDRLWVDPGGRAELHAGASTVRLGGATAATILNLDDDTTQVKLTQGTLQLRVRALPQGQQVEVDTPNLAFVPREPGDYRLDVAPDGSTTLVNMRHGSAVLYGDSRSVEMSRGQRMRFAGTDLADAGAGAYPPPDSFDQWTAARDAREDQSVAARYVPREMTGYTALDDYGDWQQDAGYGAVWFPRAVPAGWAPYSTGHWAWVAPWGWTWIDDAPWGFAPSHYGRWAHFGSRWGWVPGPIGVRPCYAPALVGFIGGATVSIRIGGGPGVAWYPLGPSDVYRPVYRASPTYITRINYVSINQYGRRGGPERDHDRWMNRNVPGAITGMPSRNFVEGRPVPRGSHQDTWRTLPVGEGRGAPPMAPIKNSLVGGAPVRALPPMARQGFERQAIAARPPGQPAQDDLARRFAREGGTAGAGPAWRGPSPVTRQEAGRGDPRGRAQPQQGGAWQPDVRLSQAALAARHRGGDPGREAPRGFVSQGQGSPRNDDNARDGGRGLTTRPEQMRGLPPEGQPPQQAVQRQQGEQQRQLQEQQRQGQDAQRRQQFELQRMAQDQQRQQMDQQRQATQRQQQFDQQRAAQEQQRQQMDQQRQATQRQQQFDQQRAMQEQQRQQMDQQRQATQRQQQFEQQRAMQEQQRQQQDQQRQATQQRQAQEQQQRAQEQQRQQQERQRQFQQQQQQQQQRGQQAHGDHGQMQARNDDRR